MSQYTKSSSDKVELRVWRDRFLLGRTPPNESFWTSNGTRDISESRTGTHGGNWREEVRRHHNAATGFSASRSTYHGGFGIHRIDFLGRSSPKNLPCWESDSGRIVYVSVPSLPTTSSDTDKEARMNLFKSANRAMRSFQTFTFLGELTETLRMLRRPGRSLFGGINDYLNTVVKRTRRVKRSNRVRIVRETYLEYVFGWSPFLNDISAAGETLNRRLERYQSSYARVSGKGKTEGHSYDHFHSQNIGGVVNTRDWGADTIWSHSIWYRGEVKSVCPNPVAADMRLLGATWSDILPAAWELVPWSFVADYFTNIGDILEAWSIRDSDWAWLISTGQLYKRTKSSNIRLDSHNITAHPRYVSGAKVTFACSPARATIKSVARATPLSGPSPSFRWKVPGIGSQKWLNLAALGSSHRRLSRHVYNHP